MSKTKHLDTAINILKGTGAAKRAPRKADAVITSEYWVQSGDYTIQVNGKVVEQGTAPDLKYVKDAEETRAARIRAMGKTVVIA